MLLSEKAYWIHFVNLDLESSDGNKISRSENGEKATNEQFCESICQTQKYSGPWVFRPIEAVEKWVEPE